MDDVKAFESALGLLPEKYRRLLSMLPERAKRRAYEIRLRTGGPVSLSLPEGSQFVSATPSLCSTAARGMPAISPQDMENTFAAVCMHSVYSHQSEIAQGYVTTPHGHRVGLCGTAVIKGNETVSMRDISSLNIRIAREVRGAADGLISVFASCTGGIIISGAPASGKTTLLRDLARQLSSGAAGASLKTAVIDERGEIASVCRSMPQFDVGPNSDIVTGMKKSDGILLALRSLSPEVMVFDEIGSSEEMAAVEQSLNSGVRVVTSIHAASVEELIRRPQLLRMLRCGAFSKIVQLSGRGDASHIETVADTEGIYAEIFGRGGHNGLYRRHGNDVCAGA